jgi:hypothetical protein
MEFGPLDELAGSGHEFVSVSRWLFVCCFTDWVARMSPFGEEPKYSILLS